MRILIIKLSSIGDVVHTLPAAAAMRRALPDARIDWVVERQTGAILRESPAIDTLIEIESRAWRKRALSPATWRDIRGCLSGIRRGRLMTAAKQPSVDVAIDFQGLIKSGFVARAAGAPRRIGFDSNELRERPSRVFLNEQVDTARYRHVINKNLALAKAVCREIDASPATFEFPIHVAPEDEAYVGAAIESIATGFAIINPGGGWPTKRWPVERFGQVADWLWTQRGLPTLVTHGPGEEEMAHAVCSAARSGAARPFASTLKQFVALARRAELFIGSDTGPLHLAAACGTPIVGLYGPTAPERNGPFDPRDVTLARDLWCREDCHRRSCWHWECMDIPVSAVTKAIEVRLNSGESRPSHKQYRVV